MQKIISDQLHNVKVLVTGSSGFIGRHLCDFLSIKGYKVISCVRQKTCNTEIFHDHHMLDLMDPIAVRNLIQQIQPDYVVHLAAITNRINSNDYTYIYEQNVISSLNLIDACRGLNNLKRFVFLGSCEEYGSINTPFKENMREQPVSAYAVSKLAISNFLQAFFKATQFPSIVLRPSLIYGPGQSSDMFLPSMIRSLCARNTFSMTNGEQTRDYLYINDLIEAINAALSHNDDLDGSIINISSGQSVTIRDLAYCTAKLIGCNSLELLDLGAIDYRESEVMNYIVSNELAKKRLNWQPKISLLDGLSSTINSIKQEITNMELP